MENRRTDDDSPVAQVRIARPTDRLAEVVSFYRDALGLEQIASFEGHAGYEGVMLALPGRRDHLEFTHHQSGSPCPAPTKDNLGGGGADLRGPGWLAGCVDARRRHLGLSSARSRVRRFCQARLRKDVAWLVAKSIQSCCGLRI